MYHTSAEFLTILDELGCSAFKSEMCTDGVTVDRVSFDGQV